MPDPASPPGSACPGVAQAVPSLHEGRAGATLTGIRLYSSGVAGSRLARVVKYRSQVPSVIMAGVIETAAHLDPVTPVLTPGIVSPGPGEALVQAGYLYFVLLNCDPGTAVWAVDVDYTPRAAGRDAEEMTP